MFNIKPLADYVIVKIDEGEETQVSGIIISKPIKPIQELAEVLAIGPEVQDIKVGDRVVFKNFHMEEFERDKQKFGILRYPDVIGIYND